MIILLQKHVSCLPLLPVFAQSKAVPLLTPDFESQPTSLPIAAGCDMEASGWGQWSRATLSTGVCKNKALPLRGTEPSPIGWR